MRYILKRKSNFTSHPSVVYEFFQRLANIAKEVTAEDDPDIAYLEAEFMHLQSSFAALTKDSMEVKDGSITLEFNGCRFEMRFDAKLKEPRGE